ncbi:sarcoplasmic calcium-binding protein 1 [Anopheles arabiensis]|uniref:AGAP007963-PA n=5 Tax=gambiae species complex TaxID=44542 RepID=Q7Q3N6_ANOGA|nr:sarcoplasmic calcium-binding protein 1 [Anopheles arabiensis]XP_040233885.1 sarcoplasmic calcium-binding protein 1 [Anopheles coluzzii]XP_041774863.1 sarcoplasmic calcium-binding protein 1 [Anopheles merus]XP_061516806.1 sarcoplasmic calcium-binding protein 1 [Anopheles gambiae]XP_061516807.1 sarcoplasmic calcium-binding protein 1 [Anopheles gambiae]XP_317508.3 sarcoplasmic calcium-binding protein 1 [Anopheles gambiae]EAA12855.3 AGAP007963-PA [Anopheles gambiae str. PEST]
MSYSWDQRVEFIVRHMYDIDNNGFLDNNDFQCMALRATVIEGKGEINPARLNEYKFIMKSLWDEISALADFDKDGKITTDEFKQAVKQTCVGKPYSEFPKAMKAFIDAHYKMMDINNDGLVSIEEYRYNCITRLAVDDIKLVDDSYNNLVSEEDNKKGGITLERYQELYAQFMGNENAKCPAIYLYGPIPE